MQNTVQGTHSFESMAGRILEASQHGLRWLGEKIRWWTAITQDYWSEPGGQGRFKAILIALVGAVCLLGLLYLIVCLLPILILMAFVSAVLTSVGHGTK